MAEKDVKEKLLEDYEDVFADIVNVLAFGGQRLLDPARLREGPGQKKAKSGDYPGAALWAYQVEGSKGGAGTVYLRFPDCGGLFLRRTGNTS